MAEFAEPMLDEGRVLDSFRAFSSGHVSDFIAARDRVAHLLGSKQRYAVGVAREDLLRAFLRQLLPRALSVDSGVVYGFERVPNSHQIDVLIWDSVHYPAVFRAEHFVVVPPEAVVAAISVKSRAGRKDIEDSVNNLASLEPIETGFREPAKKGPILKVHFSYAVNSKVETSARSAAEAVRSVLESDRNAAATFRCLREMDPGRGTEAQAFLDRRLPKLFVYLGRTSRSLMRALGPPGQTVEEAMAEPFRRRPWIYPQGRRYTTPLEKLAFQVLWAAFRSLGEGSRSLISAWADLDPQRHLRVGDLDELDEDQGVAVLPPDWSPPVAS